MDDALFIQKRKRKSTPLGQILIQEGFIDSQLLEEFLNKQSELTDEYLEHVIKEEDSKKDSKEYLIELDLRKEIIIPKVRDKYRRLSLSTGIPIIDLQHIWLVTLIYHSETYYRNTGKKKNLDLAVDVISECLTYSLRHFTVEEELVKILDHNIASHLEEHKKFKLSIVAKKNYLNSAFNENIRIEKLLSETFDFLREWYLTHIAVVDRDYAIQFEKKKEHKIPIIEKWAKQLQEKGLLKVTHLQKDIYESVTGKTQVNLMLLY